jgi:hypothetical protein
MAERFHVTAQKRPTATIPQADPQSIHLLLEDTTAPLHPPPNHDNDDPKLVKTKPRSIFSSLENRLAIATLLGMTLIAMFIHLSRETPLYSARIPPPHARPLRRRRYQLGLSPLFNHSTTTSISNTFLAERDQGSISCATMMEKVETHSIQLVAMDFDKTIVDLHTGGRWKRGIQPLVRHVRPSFRCLIRHCRTLGIPVAVTTFSRQTQLIARVLQVALQDEALLPVFGGDTWVEGYTKGKQSQLYLALEHFNREQHFTDTVITPGGTLLIDDDPENIRVAVQDGYHTILYPRHQEDDDDDDDDTEEEGQ